LSEPSSSTQTRDEVGTQGTKGSREPLRILMIAPEPVFEPRGTPISVYQRLWALSQLGHQVDLLTYHIGDDIELPGVIAHRVPDVPFVRQVRIGPSIAKLFLDFLLFCKAFLMLARGKYDAIHSHEEAAFFSMLLAALFRTRHLYDMHSSLPVQLANCDIAWARLWPWVKLFELLERWVLRTCDLVLTVGTDLEAIIQRINPSVPHIEIGNLAVQAGDIGQLVSASLAIKERLALGDRIPVVYTGTLESYQGIELLLESAQIVAQRDRQACFVIVGGRPEQVAFWQEEARRRHLEDNTRFVGTVPPTEALAYLDVAEILVSPRIGGTTVPLKVYSYLHAGKPMVATQVPAHTEVLNHANSLLVRPDSYGIAEGILGLMQDPELRKRLGDEARRHSESAFNPEGYVARMDQAYEALRSNPVTAQRRSTRSPFCSPRPDRR
jgi:glycosyltransferase involved in cell wall biosynthesis